MKFTEQDWSLSKGIFISDLDIPKILAVKLNLGKIDLIEQWGLKLANYKPNIYTFIITPIFVMRGTATAQSYYLTLSEEQLKNFINSNNKSIYDVLLDKEISNKGKQLKLNMYAESIKLKQ